MGTIELKSNIHKIVDNIQSEQVLQLVYDFLKNSETGQTGKLWNSMTEEQKNQVLSAFEESEDENNLIDIDQVIKRKA